MESKLKHLEFIQNVITRMANNSFLLKGWSLTLVSALLAFFVSNSGRWKFLLIAFLAAFIFWALDAYFLRQERLFRKLYDHVRNLQPTEIDFSMNTSPHSKEVASWLKVMWSITLWLFHLPICLAIVLVYFIFQ